MKITKRKKKGSKKASGYVRITDQGDNYHFRLRIKTSKYGGGKARGRAQVSISDKNGQVLKTESVYKSVGGTTGVWRKKKTSTSFTIPKSAFGGEGELGVVMFSTDVKGQEFYETDAFKAAVAKVIEWVIQAATDDSNTATTAAFGRMSYFAGNHRGIQLALKQEFAAHGLEVGLL